MLEIQRDVQHPKSMHTAKTIQVAQVGASFWIGISEKRIHSLQLTQVLFETCGPGVCPDKDYIAGEMSGTQILWGVAEGTV